MSVKILTSDRVIAKFKYKTFDPHQEGGGGGGTIVIMVMLIYRHWVIMAYSDKF